jgi:hypothetical protein
MQYTLLRDSALQTLATIYSTPLVHISSQIFDKDIVLYWKFA